VQSLQHSAPDQPESVEIQTPQNLTQLNVCTRSVLFGDYPCPVLQLNGFLICSSTQRPDSGKYTNEFWSITNELAVIHVHPYCSTWYTWPWMISTSGVLFTQTTRTTARDLPCLPVLKVVYDVHAIEIRFMVAINRCHLVSTGATNLDWATRQRLNASTLGCPNCSYLIALYLVLNWFANLLPWVRVTRCTFLYHYMGASVFVG